MNLFVTNTALAVHNITKETPLFAPERLAEAGKMILLGMGAVFSVLAALWLVLTLFRVFAYDLPRKRAAAASEEKQTPVAAPVEENVAEVYEEEDEGELIAVIAAAVAAYRASEGTAPEAAGGFRVVSFRRVGKGSSWNSK